MCLYIFLSFFPRQDTYFSPKGSCHNILKLPTVATEVYKNMAHNCCNTLQMMAGTVRPLRNPWQQHSLWHIQAPNLMTKVRSNFVIHGCNALQYSLLQNASWLMAVSTLPPLTATTLPPMASKHHATDGCKHLKLKNSGTTTRSVLLYWYGTQGCRIWGALEALLPGNFS